jgi:hypothetical protein
VIGGLTTRPVPRALSAPLSMLTLFGLSLFLAACGGGSGHGSGGSGLGGSSSSSSGGSGSSSSSGGSSSYTVGGTISGLGANSGLVLLNNGADPTAISAKATSFVMHSAVAYGSTYDISVGTQPYGISLACTVSDQSGTANANVTTVAVSCAPGAATKGTIVPFIHFGEVSGLAVDATGNILVTEITDPLRGLEKIPFNNGTYGMPTTIVSSFNSPGALALDSAGNVFVAASAAFGGSGAVYEIPFNNGGYGTPTTIASGLGLTAGLAVDAAHNVFVAVGATDNNSAVYEIPFTNGSYGAPVTIGSHLGLPSGVALDSAGNVFVSDLYNNAVYEIPFSSGNYGAAITIASGMGISGGLAADAAGNLFVGYVIGGTLTTGVYEIPFSNGSYGTPVSIGTGQLASFPSIALDTRGNVFVVAVSSSGPIDEIPFNHGSYGAVTTLSIGSGLGGAGGVAVDAAGNVLFVGDASVGGRALYEVPFSSGSYAAPTVIASGSAIAGGSGLPLTGGIARDIAGNVYVSLGVSSSSSTAGSIYEIPFANGTYGASTAVGSFTFSPGGVAVDALGNAFVSGSSLGNGFFFPGEPLYEIPFSNGGYGTGSYIDASSIFGSLNPSGVAVDAARNVFVVASNPPIIRYPVYLIGGGVYEIPFNNGTYGTPITIGPGFSGGLAVDITGNVFVADRTNNAVDEIPFGNGSYGAPIVVGSGFSSPGAVAVDAHGRLYVVDTAGIWVLTP